MANCLPNMRAVTERLATSNRPYPNLTHGGTVVGVSESRPELVRLRKEVRGLTQAELGEEMGVHENTVRGYENGKQEPTGERFRKYAESLRLSHSRLSAILNGTFNGDADENGHQLVPKTFSIFVALEAQAATMQVYASHLVHGLLQTERYARTLIESEHGMGSVAERLLDLRLTRQKALTRKVQPLSYRAIIYEAALYLEIGNSDVMREQLDHLEHLAQIRNIEIRLLPFSNGHSPYDFGDFILVTLPHDDGPSVAYQEMYDGPVYKETDEYIGVLTRAFDRILSMTLDADASLTALGRLRRRW